MGCDVFATFKPDHIYYCTQFHDTSTEVVRTEINWMKNSKSEFMNMFNAIQSCFVCRIYIIGCDENPLKKDC